MSGCPNEYARPVAQAVKLFDLFAKGLTPVLGGVLDQSASFVDAFRQWEFESACMRSDDSQ